MCCCVLLCVVVVVVVLKLLYMYKEKLKNFTVPVLRTMRGSVNLSHAQEINDLKLLFCLRVHTLNATHNIKLKVPSVNWRYM